MQLQGGDVKFVAVVTGEPRPEVVWTRGAAMHETNSELTVNTVETAYI